VAKKFYGETVGDDWSAQNGLPHPAPRGDRDTLAYPQPSCPSASTHPQLPVDDIELASVDELTISGSLRFERLRGFDQDDKGVMRGNGRRTSRGFKDRRNICPCSYVIARNRSISR